MKNEKFENWGNSMKCGWRVALMSLAFLFIFSALSPAHLLGADKGPKIQLKASIDKLLLVLRDENLKGVEKRELRRERIAEVVFLQFDMSRMAKYSLGRGWRDLNKLERDQFTDLFRKLMAKSYVSTIDAYAGEEISYLKEIVKGDKAEVRTVVVGGSKEIPLSYKLMLSDGRWLIYDVIIENVSLVRNYRSQLSPIIKKYGFAGLVERMEKRIALAGTKKDG
ncbi:ABC transporter substrate-binding protein [bacterium]|nr:ABC transporter substrate-binding protein [bacterium]